MSRLVASIVVRTFNEQRYLPELLAALAAQEPPGAGVERWEIETVVVDSGSTDRTVEIALCHGARVLGIAPAEFSFGRSLNRGCASARGDVLAFVSGHCVPCERSWLQRLMAPILDGRVELAYGRQVGGPKTNFSEQQLFAKFYPGISAVPQEGFFFCNNANAALRRATWEALRFDEELLGLEDMDLGKRLLATGGRIGYVAEATVFHHHAESWSQVRRRFEREAIALQRIRPEWHFTLGDLLRCFAGSVALDLRRAVAARQLLGEWRQVLLFRWMQFWGTYSGNHAHRALAEREKRRYFYPR